MISPSSDVATSIAQAGLAAPLDLSEDSRLPTAFSSAHFPAPKCTHERPGLWRAFHVGTGPDDLRHNGFFRSRRIVGAFSGIRNIRAKFLCGTTSPPIYMTAQVIAWPMGDKPDPSQLYNLSDDQLEAVKKKLDRVETECAKVHGSHRRQTHESFSESRDCAGAWVGR